MKPYLFTETREDLQLRVVEHFTILRLICVLKGSRQLGKHKINDMMLDGLRAEFQKLLYPLMAQTLEPHLCGEVQKFYKMLMDGIVGFENVCLEVPLKED